VNVTSRARARRGFTLVEMTVVLLIIAIGTALAIPMVEGGMESREVRRAARQIASTMHYCRGEAVGLGAPQALLIDVNENSIRTADWGRWAVLTERAVIEQVEGGDEVGDGIVQILCFPNGSTSGAEIVLAGRRDPRLHRLKVAFDPLIGSVRVEDLGA
jgi:general secretion pathway protein H